METTSSLRPWLSCRAWLRVLSAVLGLCVVVQAQWIPDQDLRELSLQQQNENLSVPNARDQFLVDSRLPAFSGNVRFVASNNAPVDIVVEAGGVLIFDRAHIEVVGDIILRRGGVLRLVDSDLEVFSRVRSREFNVFWEGGTLYTERSRIGGRLIGNFLTNFFLRDGVWICNSTVVHHSGGILVGEHQLPPDRQGGALIADGLFPGLSADNVRVNGRCEVVLKNSAFGVGIRLFDTGAAGSVILDAENQVPLDVVFGDANFHAGVIPGGIGDIPNSLWRLELDNTVVPRWSYQLFDVNPTAANRSYEIRNANGVEIGIHSEDLVGEPVLTGPWSSFYPPPAVLPGLPSDVNPGYHPIPPGCGVSIGNVSIEAPATQPLPVTSWGLYLGGNAGDFAVRGPSMIVEIQVRNSRLLVDGLDTYAGGVRALTVKTTETGQCTIRNAVLGSPSSQPGEVAAEGRSSIHLERVRLRRLLLSTNPQLSGGPNRGVDMGVITVDDFLESRASGESLTLNPNSRPGSIVLDRATPSQSTDLQNLDFESAPRSNGEPAFWSASGLSGSSASGLGGSGGSSALLNFGSSGGALEKQVQVNGGAPIQCSGFLRVGSLASGRTVRVELVPDVGSSASYDVTASTGGDDYFVVTLPDPSLAVREVAIRVSASGAANVWVDDLVVDVALPWEDDNLANLDFEVLTQRAFGERPNRFDPPEHWFAQTAVCHLESVDPPPGNAGSQYVVCDVLGESGSLLKRLRFVPPGRTVTVTGWARTSNPTGSLASWVYLGRADNYFNRIAPNASDRVFMNTGWQPFSVSYVVQASNPATTFAVFAQGIDSTIEVDEVEVTIQ